MLAICWLVNCGRCISSSIIDFESDVFWVLQVAACILNSDSLNGNLDALDFAIKFCLDDVSMKFIVAISAELSRLVLRPISEFCFSFCIYC